MSSKLIIYTDVYGLGVSSDQRSSKQVRDCKKQCCQNATLKILKTINWATLRFDSSRFIIVQCNGYSQCAKCCVCSVVHCAFVKHQKLTFAKTLLSRFNTHITDNTQKHSELQNIRSTLRIIGFPTRTTFLTSRQPRSQNTQYNHFTYIPYIQGTSKKVRRVRNETGVKVAMKPVHTIG